MLNSSTLKKKYLFYKRPVILSATGTRRNPALIIRSLYLIYKKRQIGKPKEKWVSEFKEYVAGTPL